MRNLFAYGSLMCGEVMEAVSGCRPKHLPAVLVDYRRWSVRDEYYPAIATEAGERVEGLLYRSVPGPAWARLDRFEGAMYVRRTVRVALPDNRPLWAEAYVVRPQWLGRLAPAEWDFGGFQRDGQAAFRRDCRG